MKLKEEINCAMDEPSFSIKIIYIHERALLLIMDDSKGKKNKI